MFANERRSSAVTNIALNNMGKGRKRSSVGKNGRRGSRMRGAARARSSTRAGGPRAERDVRGSR